VPETAVLSVACAQVENHAGVGLRSFSHRVLWEPMSSALFRGEQGAALLSDHMVLASEITLLAWGLGGSGKKERKRKGFSSAWRATHWLG